MASVYVRNGNYWLRYFDHVQNKWRAKQTPLRHPEDRRKALQLKAETTVAEMRHRTATSIKSSEWNQWVHEYLLTRYRKSEKTYERYKNSWTHLENFLIEKGITTPAGWQQEHNAAYVEWKSNPSPSETRTPRTRNVAIWDLGVLTMLMNEAKRRGFIDSNRVSKARIKRDDTKLKPAITDEQIAILRAALAKHEDKNLPVAFEIALHTGCRLSETALPFDRINFERDTITFIPKGGESRTFSVPIIFPTFREWLVDQCRKRKAAGFNTVCDVSGLTSRNFARLCDRLKLNDITFHALRVTFITRAYEAGLSSEVVRKLVNHADILVNRLYQRMSIEGLRGLGERLKIPVVGSPASMPETPSAKPKPQKRATSRLLKASLPVST